jgi:hypothetical protein
LSALLVEVIVAPVRVMGELPAALPACSVSVALPPEILVRLTPLCQVIPPVTELSTSVPPLSEAA